MNHVKLFREEVELSKTKHYSYDIILDFASEKNSIYARAKYNRNFQKALLVDI